MSKDSKILNPFFKKEYPVISHGKRIYMYDEDGKEYIDGTSGAVLCSLGHGLEEMGDVLKAQTEKISFVYRWDCVTDILEQACNKICEASENHFSKVFYVSGGSEATEIAVKLARKYHLNKGNHGKYKVISRWQSYHGSTMGVLSLTGFTGRRAGYEPYLHEFGHIPPAYCYRCWYNKEPKNCNIECAQALENEILSQGPDSVSAFIMEPISGMSICAARPRDDYYEKIKEICKKYDVLLIFDEVMTGIGRTGKYFAYQYFNVKPDIIALGKALCGGYFPIGAVACTEALYETIYNNTAEFPPGYSWAGNPLGCAVVVKTFEYIEEHHLITKSAENGAYLKQRLESLHKHPTVGDIRGLGMMVGIEFVKNKSTKEAFGPEVGYSLQINQEALKRGMFIELSSGCDKGVRGDMIMAAPAFIITKEEIDKMVDILDETITAVEERNGFLSEAIG
ncbi:MAG: aminotransferase class III-fold pyridoxal phosphate-dependent enzyme [Clostridia bacterium]|nr:aminotransferase class III-fold pyridoxal phosphate-dependent enzyme [Clostridia bacterium]